MKKVKLLSSRWAIPNNVKAARLPLLFTLNGTFLVLKGCVKVLLEILPHLFLSSPANPCL